MNNFSPSGIDNRIFLPFVTLGGLVLAVIMGRWVAQGNTTNIMYVFLFFGALTFLLWTGDKYWYGIPFALGSGLPSVPLGVRNIELGELMILASTAIFIARVAMKKERPIIFRASHIPVLLFVAWVVMVYALNPTGLVLFGAGTAGGRNYLKIALAFSSFIILASQNLTEERLKWPILLMFIGTVVSAFYGFASYTFSGPSESQFMIDEGEGGYTWHQSLAGPTITFSFLMFAKYKPSQVFSLTRPGLAFFYLFAILITLYSGKRMGTIAVIMAPLLGAMIHKQYGYVFMAGLAMVLVSSIIVLGQGSAFALPKAMQRAVSFLPAQWDPEFQNMTLGGDTFRSELRRYAVARIKKNPIIGRGYSLDVTDVSSMLASGTSGDMSMGIAAGAAGSAWHNTWLGYSADFGIPLTLIHASVWLSVIVVAFRLARRLPVGSYRSILVIFVLMFTLRDLIASHTSGHTAGDAYMRWWMYGGLFSIWAAYLAQRKGNSGAQHATPSLAGSVNALQRVTH